MAAVAATRSRQRCAPALARPATSPPPSHSTHHPRSNDDEQRFDFFCKAALEFLLQTGRQPDILHCHDWWAGRGVTLACGWAAGGAGACHSDDTGVAQGARRRRVARTRQAGPRPTKVPSLLAPHPRQTAHVAKAYWDDYHPYGLWKPKVGRGAVG
jgi:hypothetical protein